MKNLIYILLLASATVSCKSYMVSTIAADTDTKRTSDNAFLIENDSLRITYNFSGMDAPMKIDIYNKLKEPVYINWNNSALIIKDKAYSFTQSNVVINGNSSATTSNYGSRTQTFTDGSLNAVANLPVNESFIPPAAQITKTITILDAVGFDSFAKSEYKSVPLNFEDGSGVVYLKKADFQTDNSPLKFKSYITLYTLQQGIAHNFVSTGNFYVSSVARSSANPNKISDYVGNPGNVMMTSKTSGFGKALTGVALVGAVGGLAVADQAINEKKAPNN